MLFRDFDKRVEIRSTRDGLIRFHGHSEAVLYLRKHRDRPGLTAALRQVLAEHLRLDAQRLSDDQVIDEVAQRLLNGSLQLMEIFEPRAEAGAAMKGLLAKQAEEPIEVEEAPPAPVPAPAVPVAKKTWIAIQLVDMDGKPIQGERFRIELPDGRVIEGTTDADGKGGASDIEPGTCKVTFPDLDSDAWEQA